MSNIRTLNDLRGNNQPGNRNPQPQNNQDFNVVRGNQPFTAKTCFFILFPNFSVKSVTFAYVMIFTIIHIIDEVIYFIKINQQTTTDQMTWGCVLYKSGAKFTYAISKQAQLHRLLMPMFLHSGFVHLFWNIFSFFMIGFTVEKELKSSQKYIALLVLGAIAGNVVSALADPTEFGVGASTSLFAVLGSLCVWFFINYTTMSYMQLNFMVFFGLMVFFSLLNGFMAPGSAVDSWGHLGGFLAGVPLSFYLYKCGDIPTQKRIDKYKKLWALMLIGIYGVCTALIFFRPLPYCDIVDCKNICASF